MPAHWMDRIGSLITGIPRIYEPLFRDGWGGPERLARLETLVGEPLPPVQIDLESRVISERSDIRITDLRFVSPAGDLPRSSKMAQARLIEPHRATRLAIGFASFNDHGYRTRTEMVRPLIRGGTAVALLENPFYGSRRPHPTNQPMRTVADLLTMGAAAVWEGQSLASSLSRGADWLIGFFGYSMGGNITALAAATAPFPVACAALAASHSPGPVFTEGALRAAVAWDALGGEASVGELARVLGSASVLRFPAPPWARSAVILSPTADGYIPEHAVRDLHEHWPGSKFEHVAGGHASVLMWHRRALAKAISESFDRLEVMT